MGLDVAAPRELWRATYSANKLRIVPAAAGTPAVPVPTAAAEISP